MTKSTDASAAGGIELFTQRLAQVLPEVLEIFICHPDIGSMLEREARTGFVLCTAPIDEVESKHKTLVGEVTPEQGKEYDSYSGEEINRLSEHPEHVASSESSGEEERGGAIRGRQHYVSIAGLDASAYNELMAILIAVGIDDITFAEAQELLRRTKNLQARFFPYFHRQLNERLGK